MKNLIKLFAILTCVVSFANFGKAVTIKSMEFEIPFNFIVRGKTHAAGKYSIKRLNDSDPNFLVLKNTEGNGTTLLLTQGIGSEKQNKQSSLTFKRSNRAYFLDAIWLINEKQGYQLLLNQPREGGKTEIVQSNN